MSSFPTEKAKTAFRNPRLVCRELNRVAHRVVPRWNHRVRGDDFVDADWDNLLVLDACRYDLFADENTIEGDLQQRRSRASSTVGFLRTNVSGKDLTDTVYVTANGQVHNHADELDVNFHDVLPLYAEEWDDDLGTVPPDAVTDRAIEAGEEYPNKRLLVHYVQPHFPFIGADTTEDKHRIKENEYDRPFWRRVFDGNSSLTREEIWAAYKDTLRMALPHAERAVESLSGRTVVTSDHGNMFGERGYPIPIREWGHPDGLYYPQLVEVPWLVVDGNRRRIVSEPPQDRDLAPDPAVVKDRLEDLGYK